MARGGVDLDRYAALDGAWRALGLSAPARRALVDAGVLTTDDLRGLTWPELARLHGIGPSTYPKLLPYVGRPAR